MNALLAPLTTPLAQALDARLPSLYRSHLVRLFAASATPPEETPARFGARQLLLGALLGMGGLIVALLGSQEFLIVPLALLAGLVLPYSSLRGRVRRRQRELIRGLPFSLDLLTLAVEAGLEFAQALTRVTEKCAGPLRDEFQTVLRELRLGRTRAEAIRGLAERVSIPAYTRLSVALLQADRMGIPLGKALRSLAAQQRSERSQRAEKLANEAPVKLLLPLVTCFFPMLFLILFGPLVFQFLFGGGDLP